MTVLLLFLLTLHTTGWVNISMISRLELWAYDLRLKANLDTKKSQQIIIVDIDEKSLGVEGQWPWSRDRLATLIDQLFNTYGVTLVGMDVVFAEPDRSSQIDVLEQLNRLNLSAQQQVILTAAKTKLDLDQRLALSIKNHPVVLGYYFNDKTNRTSGSLPAPVFTAEQLGSLENSFIAMKGFGANLEDLQHQSAAAGHFNPYIDIDGINRRTPAIIEYQKNYYESLALAMARTMLWVDHLEPGISAHNDSYRRMEWIGLADFKVPVDDRGCILIPYRGSQGMFSYYSAVDILNGAIVKEDLQNAIVLIGTTAPGLMDLRSTPLSAAYPGVEVQASLLAGILDQTIWHSPSWMKGAELLQVLFIGVLLFALLPLLNPLWSIVLTAAVTAATLGINQWLWQQHLVLPLASSLLLIGLLYIWNMTYGFFAEFRDKKRVSHIFGQYVPPAIVTDMAKNPGAFSIAGESREMTVLFSDVRDFTAISERLEATELTRMMNAYLTPMTEIIHRQQGTIDKYIGDAIMAFWGAPVDDPQHSRHAVLAALDMLNKINQLNNEFEQQGWPRLKIGIGLNTGIMNVGNMGSEFRMAYTVMGDAVNLGARLESLTKEYGVNLIISETTQAVMPDLFCRELDRIQVKGKEQPVTIYQPIGLMDEMSSFQIHPVEQFHDALENYRQAQWHAAESILNKLHDKNPEERLYRLYLDRIKHFREQPHPESWDGVFRFAHK